MTTLTTNASDGGTLVVTATFTDEDGASVTPNALTWSLRSWKAKIVNSRDSVSITPAATVTIALSGDDLLQSDGGQRWLTIEGDYNSTAGNGLSLTGECTFYINDFVGV